MVNSMINGAISEVADPEYVEYVRRHIQGLFENFAPVLMKSKSNEEMAINSPSRDKIVEIINQSIPKSLSLDFKLLAENCRDEDGMDFSKFGLGIDDQKNTNQLLLRTRSEMTEKQQDDQSEGSQTSSSTQLDNDGDVDLNKSFLGITTKITTTKKITLSRLYFVMNNLFIYLFY
jgi:hypothetical protein